MIEKEVIEHEKVLKKVTKINHWLYLDERITHLRLEMIFLRDLSRGSRVEKKLLLNRFLGLIVRVG